MTMSLSRREEFALITIDRPDALNALSVALIEEIDAALDEVAKGDARALLITGAGARAFSAGADVTELTGRTPAGHRQGSRRGQHVFSRLDTLAQPSVAIVNGYAFGGGLELALACTFRLATANATMGLPEIKLGLMPAYGGTQRLPRIIGEARALEMVMTGRTVDAEEAARIGLVNRLIEGDPVEAGIAYAREFSSFGLPALGFAREAVKRALDLPFAQGLQAEADLAALGYQSEDAREGTAAFLEKRKPAFKDR